MKHLFQKITLAFVAIFFSVSVASAASAWEGIWKGQLATGGTADFYLFSDNYFYAEFVWPNFESGGGSVYLKAKLEATIFGTWSSESADEFDWEAIQVSPNVEFITTRGMSDWDRMYFVKGIDEQFKNDLQGGGYTVEGRVGNKVVMDNAMVLTKTATALPFYYVAPKSGKFTLLDLEDVPSQVYMRGKYTASNGESHIGLFIRGNVIDGTDILTRVFNAKGELIKTIDADVLSTEETATDLEKTDNWIDMQKTPASGTGTYSFTNGNKYSGSWSAHRPHGQGKMVYANGDVFEGTWAEGKLVDGNVVINEAKGVYTGSYKNGAKEGAGHYDYSNGGYEDGIWVNGKFTNGTASWYLSNNGNYIGEITGGKMTGKGKFTGSNGTWEEGQFVDGELIEGTCLWKFSRGGEYTGEIHEGKLNGHGVYTYSNGAKYDGQFANGDFTGQGVLTYNDIVYEGTWAKDLLQEGKITCNQFTYEGTLKDGVFDIGTLTQGGLVLSGTWDKQRLIQGTFVVVNTLGDFNKAQGQYDNNIKETTFFCDAIAVTANWTDNPGAQTIVFANGEKLEGLWADASSKSPIIDSDFRYTWTDGTVATGKVNKKFIPTKTVFVGADGAELKGKAAKAYVMQFLSEGTFVHSVNIPTAMKALNSQLSQSFEMPKYQ